MNKRNKIFFVSDAHLGINDQISSTERETILINWLDEIKEQALEINFLGDIFDFWFEYKYLVPSGFARLLAKLRELSENKIIINFFTGNHDLWTFGYLQNECKVNIFRKPMIREIDGKIFFIGHGDGLGGYSVKHNLLKWMFTHRFFQFLFKIIHPSISFRIAVSCSKLSYKKQLRSKNINPDDEILVKYAKKILEKKHIHFFVFGHRHKPFQINIGENSVFTSVGDWVNSFSYAVYEENNLFLHKYDYLNASMATFKS